MIFKKSFEYVDMGEAEPGNTETVIRDWVRAATRGRAGGQCEQLCLDEE